MAKRSKGKSMADHFQTGVKMTGPKGKLLVATPKLDSDMFRKTVIFCYDHTQAGSQGFVINRPSPTTTVSKLFENNSIHNLQHTDGKLHHGGPVSERNISMLHSGEWYSQNTIPINKHFSVSSDTHMLEKMSMMNEPNEWMMLAGKSAWRPGQLETELEQNCWLVLDAVPAIVYTSGTDQLWDLCVDLCSQEMINTYF